MGSLLSLLDSSFCPKAQACQFPFHCRHLLFLITLLLSSPQCPGHIREAVSLCTCPRYKPHNHSRSGLSSWLIENVLQFLEMALRITVAGDGGCKWWPPVGRGIIALRCLHPLKWLLVSRLPLNTFLPTNEGIKEHSSETALHWLPLCLCLGNLTLLRSSDYEKFIRSFWTPFLF